MSRTPLAEMIFGRVHRHRQPGPRHLRVLAALVFLLAGTMMLVACGGAAEPTGSLRLADVAGTYTGRLGTDGTAQLALTDSGTWHISLLLKNGQITRAQNGTFAIREQTIIMSPRGEPEPSVGRVHGHILSVRDPNGAVAEWTRWQ